MNNVTFRLLFPVLALHFNLITAEITDQHQKDKKAKAPSEKQWVSYITNAVTGEFKAYDTLIMEIPQHEQKNIHTSHRKQASTSKNLVNQYKHQDWLDYASKSTIVKNENPNINNSSQQNTTVLAKDNTPNELNESSQVIASADHNEINTTKHLHHNEEKIQADKEIKEEQIRHALINASIASTTHEFNNYDMDLSTLKTTKTLKTHRHNSISNNKAKTAPNSTISNELSNSSTDKKDSDANQIAQSTPPKSELKNSQNPFLDETFVAQIVDNKLTVKPSAVPNSTNIATQDTIENNNAATSQTYTNKQKKDDVMAYFASRPANPVENAQINEFPEAIPNTNAQNNTLNPQNELRYRDDPIYNRNQPNLDYVSTPQQNSIYPQNEILDQENSIYNSPQQDLNDYSRSQNIDSQYNMNPNPSYPDRTNANYVGTPQLNTNYPINDFQYGLSPSFNPNIPYTNYIDVPQSNPGYFDRDLQYDMNQAFRQNQNDFIYQNIPQGNDRYPYDDFRYIARTASTQDSGIVYYASPEEAILAMQNEQQQFQNPSYNAGYQAPSISTTNFTYEKPMNNNYTFDQPISNYTFARPVSNYTFVDPISLELRCCAFIPSSNLFREIYGNVAVCGELQASAPIYNDVELWTNFAWLSKSGHPEGFPDPTTINIANVSVGILYNFKMGNGINPYLGFGGCFANVYVRNKSSCTGNSWESRFAAGAILKSGVNYFITNQFFLDFFLDYLYQPVNFDHAGHRSENVGGVKIGMGAGVKF